ncbi:hypothetical protein EVJ58_g9347 [Rhodofomes roseus]|uniref:RNA exonuclease 4 n=1 Tax=Rhodofomes roseus TaxID=34475 RepID=A0A4Y9XWX3_9APHY|nr:hypothetical protein EVJ58_g9347 [Rhodofomes roseus]
MSRQTTTAQKPSSNWLALKKKLPSDSRKSVTPPPKKKRKTGHESEDTSEIAFIRGKDISSFRSVTPTVDEEDLQDGDPKAVMRKMIAGAPVHLLNHQQPGKYLALDCEMVGVGPEGRESSLARVSIVNFYGHVLLDVYVRQRERVVDYRTQYSGIRPSDMVDAKPFPEVQQQVADLLKDRILALFLSHPRQQTRDTQVYAHKHKVVKTKWAALRNLVQQELGVAIQTGEHSSVTDARATMAVFRLHHKEWEKGQRPDGPLSTKKRKRAGSVPDATHATSKSTTKVSATVASEFPGGGRKGVSSGLSTIVKRKETVSTKTNDKWWTKLG